MTRVTPDICPRCGAELAEIVQITEHGVSVAPPRRAVALSRGATLAEEVRDHVLYDTEHLVFGGVRLFADAHRFTDGSPKGFSPRPPEQLAEARTSDSDTNLFTAGMLPPGYRKDVRAVLVDASTPGPLRVTFPSLSGAPHLVIDNVEPGAVVELEDPLTFLSLEYFSVIVETDEPARTARVRVFLVGPLWRPTAG